MKKNCGRSPWTKSEVRTHQAVISGKLAPTLVIQNATYLNHGVKAWRTANIWISGDRIVYVGPEMPEQADAYHDATGQYIVPGYIEPHAHPFQLYNPASLAKFAAERGTSTLVNDNMLLLLEPTEQAFAQVEALADLPTSMYWWARLDAQTELDADSISIDNRRIQAWLKHPQVIQAGELTGWPRLSQGDDELLHWMQDAIKLGKPIEGHFPGASAKTLTKMALYGVTSDHEAMTVEEAMTRLELGYTTTIRYSSIRPDLPDIFKGLVEAGLTQFDKVLVTTDGSTPSFYKAGMLDETIRLMLEAGIPVEEAYRIASYNAARHFNLDHLLGSIAPGRIAHLNFLEAKDAPTPVAVLARGIWVRQADIPCYPAEALDAAYALMPQSEVQISLTEQDFSFSMPVGLEMVNSVIMTLYQVEHDTSVPMLPAGCDESFLMLLDREGKWRLNTVLKNFATQVGGLVSSYSISGDILMIGKSKRDMQVAFERMKTFGGGIVLVEDGEVIAEVPLTLMGQTSDLPLEDLIVQETALREALFARGYAFEDPVYTLLFLASTHLPYVRITPQGIYEVLRKKVLFPAILR
ncbi:MAG TPA: adenosine deaminase [Exiguobacterium sp.]|nr:adenosine deaminase [Exiguobacterium sp.]